MKIFDLFEITKHNTGQALVLRPVWRLVEIDPPTGPETGPKIVSKWPGNDSGIDKKSGQEPGPYKRPSNYFLDWTQKY